MPASASSRPSMLVVGGGIGGLVFANYIRDAGYPVTIVEQKAEYTLKNSGGGLSLTDNATRLLFALGLKEELEEVSVHGVFMKARRSVDSGRLVDIRAGRRYKFHRYDLLVALSARAKAIGVKMLMGRSVVSIREGEMVVAGLDNGEEVSADLLVGADGVHSKVRRLMLGERDVKPELTGHCTFLVDVPESAMLQDADTKEIYEDGKAPFHFFMGKQSTVVSWCMVNHSVYHMQINDHAYGTGSRWNVDDSNQTQYVSRLPDLDSFRKRFDDYGGAIGKVFDKATSGIKWLIAELPDLPTWSSSSGRVVLLGDAAHCFAPYAGQGSCMAIEDGATLAELVKLGDVQTWSRKHIADVYEKMRRPRVEQVKGLIKGNIERWSNPEGPSVSSAKSPKDQARAARQIEDYDAIGDARQYMAQGQSKLA